MGSTITPYHYYFVRVQLKGRSFGPLLLNTRYRSPGGCAGGACLLDFDLEKYVGFQPELGNSNTIVLRQQPLWQGCSREEKRHQRRKLTTAS
jgi:hypothetical protein